MGPFGLAARRLACLALVLPHALLAAQDLSFADVVRGGRFPTTLRLEEIPEDFRAVKLKVAGGGTLDMISSMLGPFAGLMMAMGGASETTMKGPEEALLLIDTVWTRGEEVRVGDGNYLVTYRIDMDLSMFDRPAKPDAAKAPPILKLDLVRTSSINAISPRPDITRESFRRAFAAPSASRQATTARDTTVSNAKQVAVGMIMYCADNDDFFPYVNDTKTAFYVIHPYVKSKELFRTLNPNGGTFRMNMAISGVSMTVIEEPARTPLFYDSREWPDGTRVVAFTDSHVKVVTAEEWADLQRYLRLGIRRYGPAIPSQAAEFDRMMRGEPYVMPPR